MKSEFCIETKNKEQRTLVQNAIRALGTIEDNWPDGSFNFKCYDEDCTDELGEIMEEKFPEVEMRLI